MSKHKKWGVSLTLKNGEELTFPFAEGGTQTDGEVLQNLRDMLGSGEQFVRIGSSLVRARDVVAVNLINAPRYECDFPFIYPLSA